MLRPETKTKEIELPSGIKAVVKETLTYGDNKAIIKESVGTVESEGDSKLTIGEGMDFIAATVKKMIVSWDVTEADGTPTELSQENIDEILTQDDVNILMNLSKVAPEKKS